MDNNSLLNLKNRLETMPFLENRLEKLNNRIREAQAEVDALLRKYEKESMDVERIQKESLSATILKLLGRYEGRVEKEMQEMVHAKTQYDAATIRLRELESEAADLRARIEELIRDKRAYQEEMDRREACIKKSLTSEAAQSYLKLCEKAGRLSRELTETEEALRAARRACNTARSVLEYLDDAEGWATYDVWAGKGLLSHMAKYEKLDMAQEEFEKLITRIDELRQELDDIDLDISLPQITIDSATRIFDYWFDNIFTDLKVREKIRDYRDEVQELLGRIQKVIGKLETVKEDLNEAISLIGEQQESILLSFEAGE